MVQFRLFFSENKNRKHVVECFPVCKSAKKVFPVRTVLGLVGKVLRLDRKLQYFCFAECNMVTTDYVGFLVRCYVHALLKVHFLESINLLLSRANSKTKPFLFTGINCWKIIKNYKKVLWNLENTKNNFL